MAGEVVNQAFVHLINSCGRLKVRASNRHFFKPSQNVSNLNKTNTVQDERNSNKDSWKTNLLTTQNELSLTYI